MAPALGVRGFAGVAVSCVLCLWRAPQDVVFMQRALVRALLDADAPPLS